MEGSLEDTSDIKDLPKGAFVVESNYDFWVNEEDDEYDKIIVEKKGGS